MYHPPRGYLSREEQVDPPRVPTKEEDDLRTLMELGPMIGHEARGKCHAVDRRKEKKTLSPFLMGYYYHTTRHRSPVGRGTSGSVLLLLSWGVKRSVNSMALPSWMSEGGSFVF
jgi:hypothetical protein